MKSEVKKRLAKEYLLLISCIATGLVCFISLSIYLWINTSKLTELNIQLETRKDRISKVFGDGEVWPRLQTLVRNDSVKYRWDSKWNENGLRDQFITLGFKNPQEIIDFVDNNSTEELQENQTKILERIRSIDHGDNIWKISLYVSLFAAIIIFPVRYLYVSINHSINVLKR